MNAKPVCPYCGNAAELVPGLVIYPHRPDLAYKSFWRCGPCGAWVGCHPQANKNGRGGIGDGTVPLGRLANADLRIAKQAAHAAFDPLWRDGKMSRTKAYKWLASALGIPPNQCHIGEFDTAQCFAVISAVNDQRAKS